jgi:uncharacterized membrane-anchored protein YitT (DUF2179 family)
MRHESANHQINLSYCPLQIFGWLLIGRFMTMYRILATKWYSLLVSEILLGLGFANLLHSMTPWPPVNNTLLQGLFAIAYY